MNSDRDLGNLGETEFSGWCLQIGIVPNKSTIDKTGWDFIIEFPFANQNFQTDIAVGANECKVQVKSTDTNRLKPIKLSNLKRFATCPQPSFIIGLKFNKTTKPVEAYLFHIDKIYMEKILKRCYSLNQDELCKKTMSFNLKNAYKLTSLDGNGLKDAILKFVGNNLNDYVAEKNQNLSKLGFDKNNLGEVKFDIVSLDNLIKLIDVSLGLSPEVEVHNIKGIMSRFDIPELKPFIDSESAKIQMKVVPTSSGKIYFKENDLTQGIAVSAKFYQSCFNSHVPLEYKKIRIDGSFFQMVFSGSICQVSLSIPSVVRMPAQELMDMMKVFHLIQTNKDSIYIEYKSLNEHLPLGSFSPQKSDFDLEKYLNILENILFLANKFSLSELLISFEEINISFDKIKNFFHLITANPEEIKITFRSIEESSKSRLDSNLEDLYLISVFIKLGNFYISQILGLFGKVDEGTDPNTFKAKKIEMLTNICIHEKEYTPDLKEKIQIKIDSLTEKYSKSHNIFVEGN